MKNIDDFYNKSQKINRPSGLLKGFFNMNLDKQLNEKIAIDLGSGAGNDAKFLLDNAVEFINDCPRLNTVEDQLYRDLLSKKMKF